MPQLPSDRLCFDDVVIDFAGRRLLRDGREQTLEPKAFAVLALLARSPGQVFARDEILDAVWGHRHVTQSVLNRIMSLLRQALGEDAQHPRLLHTVHAVGYRFELPASATTPAVAPADVESLPVSTSLPAPDLITGRAQRLRKRWPAVALSALTILAVCAAVLWLRNDAPTSIAADEPSAPAVQPSLAVLSFADLSELRDQEYLADGLTEEILNQLAQVSGLRVVGRSSSFSFKGKNEDLRVIGQKLGVTHVLEGSVRKAGEQLRITAQLIRADDGTHLWSKTYTSVLPDVFTVQEDISRDVARSLSVKLDVVTFNREQGGTTNVEAYERFLRWRGIVMAELFDFEHDRERLQLSREMVALDPQCMLCRDALASSLDSMANHVGGEQAERLRAEAVQVREYIGRVAPESWVAKRDRSNVLWREGKRAEAIALAKEIADTGPPTKERVWDYAYMIFAMGHLNETIALVEQVRAVEPMALFLSRDLQFDYTAARRFADAEAEYQRGLKLEGNQQEPNYVAFLRQLAGKRPGGIDELRTLYRQLLRQTKELDSPFFRDLGNALDDRGAMLALVRKALSDAAYRGIDPAYVPIAVADALGDADLAVTAMRKNLEAQTGFSERAIAQYAYVVFWISPYSNLRAHPEFKQLLIETGVADYWRQTGKWGDGCMPIGTDDFQCR